MTYPRYDFLGFNSFTVFGFPLAYLPWEKETKIPLGIQCHPAERENKKSKKGKNSNFTNSQNRYKFRH